MNTSCPSGFGARCARPYLFLSALWLALLPAAANAQLVVYSFGTSGTPTVAPTTLAPNLSASAFGGNLGSPGTGSGVPVHSGGSGGSFFSASNWGGAAPGTNYFEFSLAPAAGYGFTVETLAFAYRATSSGPTSFAVRSSVDGFASNLAAGTFLADSAWHASGSLALGLASALRETTFRLYAAGASSTLGTLRVDDVSLAGSVSAIPEPSTWAAILGGAALGGALWRRRGRAPHA